MIFVAVGTEAYPFDRLIKMIDELKARKKITENVFIQLGSCRYTPKFCRWKKWLPFDKMRANIKKARIVVIHAGTGTTLLCLHCRKKPILVPRKHKYGEHLDNHQKEFAEMMEGMKYAAVAESTAELEKCIVGQKSGNALTRKINGCSQLARYLNEWALPE